MEDQRRPSRGGYRRRPIRTGTSPRWNGKRSKQAPRSTWWSRRSARSLRGALGTLSHQSRCGDQTGQRILRTGKRWLRGARAGSRRDGYDPARYDPDRRGRGWGLFRRSGGPAMGQRLVGRRCTRRRVQTAEARPMQGGVRPRHLGKASLLRVNDARVEP